MTADRIPATIVTGFLGSGKTTLIRNVINSAAGRRIAVIVNEFGDIGFDASLIADCDDPACSPDEIVELTNGCICCTVADEFLPTMEALLARDPAPEHIVVETSGLALPQPLVRAFAWPPVRHRVTVDGVITVVDAEAVTAGRLAPDPDAAKAQAEKDAAIEHDNPVAELFEDQLKCADMIVVTKGDLTGETAKPAVESVIRETARAGTPIIHTGGQPISAGSLMGLESVTEDNMAGRESHHDIHHGDHDHHHDHDDFDTFAIERAEYAGIDDLKAAVARALEVPGVLRVKGRAAIAGKAAPATVQAVGHRLEAWFSPEAEATGLVVIGLKDMPRDDIVARLGLRGA